MSLPNQTIIAWQTGSTLSLYDTGLLDNSPDICIVLGFNPYFIGLISDHCFSHTLLLIYLTTWCVGVWGDSLI